MKQLVPCNIVCGFNNKEESAFEILFRFYFADMCAISYKITNDWHDSEDAVQRAFIKLWHHSAMVKNSEHLYAILITIVRNESLNYVKSKANKHRKQSRETIDDTPEEGEDEQEYVRAARLHSIRKFLQTLPLACRVAMEMRLNGLTQQQIAKRLNITVGSVAMQHHRAINKLKEYFGNANKKAEN